MFKKDFSFFRTRKSVCLHVSLTFTFQSLIRLLTKITTKHLQLVVLWRLCCFCAINNFSTWLLRDPNLWQLQSFWIVWILLGSISAFLIFQVLFCQAPLVSCSFFVLVQTRSNPSLPLASIGCRFEQKEAEDVSPCSGGCRFISSRVLGNEFPPKGDLVEMWSGHDQTPQRPRIISLHLVLEHLIGLLEQVAVEIMVWVVFFHKHKTDMKNGDFYTRELVSVCC